MKLRAGQTDDDDMMPIREAMLDAAALSVAELLSLPPDQEVTANLLVFTDATLLQMQTVGRSTKGRKTPDGARPRDGLIAYAAIQQGRTILVDDICADTHWAPRNDPVYRAVFAVPVGFDGRACAALTIDHDVPFTFYGRGLELALQLEPYAASLALTYGDEAHYHPCQYEPRNA